VEVLAFWREVSDALAALAAERLPATV